MQPFLRVLVVGGPRTGKATLVNALYAGNTNSKTRPVVWTGDSFDVIQTCSCPLSNDPDASQFAAGLELLFTVVKSHAEVGDLALLKHVSFHCVIVVADATQFDSMIAAAAWKSRVDARLAASPGSKGGHPPPPCLLAVCKANAVRDRFVDFAFQANQAALAAYCTSNGYHSQPFLVGCTLDSESEQEMPDDLRGLTKAIVMLGSAYKAKRDVGATLRPAVAPADLKRLSVSDLTVAVRASPQLERVVVLVQPKLQEDFALLKRSASLTFSPPSPATAAPAESTGSEIIQATQCTATQFGGRPALSFTFLASPPSREAPTKVTRSRHVSIAFEQTNGRFVHWSGCAEVTIDGSVVMSLRQALFLALTSSTANSQTYSEELLEGLLEVETATRRMERDPDTDAAATAEVPAESEEARLAARRFGNPSLPWSVDCPVFLRFRHHWSYLVYDQAIRDDARNVRPAPYHGGALDSTGLWCIRPSSEGSNDVVLEVCGSVPKQYLTAELRLGPAEAAATFLCRQHEWDRFSLSTRPPSVPSAAMQYLGIQKGQLALRDYHTECCQFELFATPKPETPHSAPPVQYLPQQLVQTYGQSPQNTPLARCARYLVHRYIVHRGATLAGNDSLFDEILKKGNPARWIEDMVASISTESPAASPSTSWPQLLSGSASPVHPTFGDATKMLTEPDPSTDTAPTVAHTLHTLGALQPLISLHEVVRRWRQVRTAAAPSNTEPHGVPPVTRFFYAALPAITHIALQLCHLSFEAAKEQETRDYGFFERVVRAILAFFGKGDGDYQRIDQEYTLRVVTLTSLLKGPLFDASRHLRQAKTPFVSLEELHRSLLEFELQTKLSTLSASDMTAHLVEGNAVSKTHRAVYFHLYVAMVKIARVQALVERAKLVGIYGLQDTGKSTLLQRFGFVPRSIGGTSHTREPIAYEFPTSPTQGTAPTSQSVYLMIDLPGVNDQHQERGRLQAMVVPTLSALFILQPMINGADLESLEALTTLEGQLQESVPVAVLLVKPNRRFKELLDERSLSQSSQPLHAKLELIGEETSTSLLLEYPDPSRSEPRRWQWHGCSDADRQKADALWNYLDTVESNRTALRCRRVARGANAEGTLLDALAVTTRAGEGPLSVPILFGSVASPPASPSTPPTAPKTKEALVVVEDKGLQTAHRTYVINTLKRTLRTAISNIPSDAFSWPPSPAQDAPHPVLVKAAFMIQEALWHEAHAAGDCEWLLSTLKRDFGPTRFRFDPADRRVELPAAGWCKADAAGQYCIVNAIESYAALQVPAESVRLEVMKTLGSEAHDARARIVRRSSVLANVPPHLFMMYSPLKLEDGCVTSETGALNKWQFYMEFLGKKEDDRWGGATDANWLDDHVRFATAPALEEIVMESQGRLRFVGKDKESQRSSERKFAAICAKITCDRVLSDRDVRFVIQHVSGWVGRVEERLLQLLAGP